MSEFFSLRQRIRRKMGRVWTHAVYRSSFGRLPYAEISAIYPDFQKKSLSDDVLRQVLRVCEEALAIDLSDVSARMGGPMKYPNIWPGEHYRLLAAWVKLLQPKRVVEIGTYQGLSSLSLKKYLPQDGHLLTLDIIPWSEIEGVCLCEDDFKDGRLVQEIADLSCPKAQTQYKQELESADLIFLDGPKDGVFEYQLWDYLQTLSLKPNSFIIWDDIRTQAMLKLWHSISWPKLDLTSFGHYSGTGVVAIQGG